MITEERLEKLAQLARQAFRQHVRDNFGAPIRVGLMPWEKLAPEDREGWRQVVRVVLEEGTRE